jgi:hypothetical protein
MKVSANTIARTSVVRNGQYYLISTVFLPLSVHSRPYETGVFKCTADGTVTDLTELNSASYKTKDGALQGHNAFVAQYLEGE